MTYHRIPLVFAPSDAAGWDAPVRRERLHTQRILLLSRLVHSIRNSRNEHRGFFIYGLKVVLMETPIC